MRAELLNASDVDARLAALQIPSISEDQAKVWPYREAAAVLADFDPFRLKVNAPSYGRRNALELLRHDSIESFDEAGRLRWSLRAEVRRAALKRLRSAARMRQMLKLNARSRKTQLQQMVEDALWARLHPLESYSRKDLAALLVVCGWLYGILPHVPQPDRIRQEIRKRTLMEPFEILICNFKGRIGELQQLEKYFFFDRPRPLPLIGLGGSGKSSLIAKFIKEHLGAKAPFHFAYLDFDRPEMVASQPITLLIEALRQITTQNNHNVLGATAHDLKRIAEKVNAETSGADSLLSGEEWDLRSGADVYIDAFVDALKHAGVLRSPVLLVLDTFEEVQYQGLEIARSLLAFVLEIMQRSKKIRVVIASRSPIGGNQVEDAIVVGDLDFDAAVGFLMTHGIRNTSLAAKWYHAWVEIH